MSDKPILMVEDNPDDIALAVLAFEQNDITNELIVTSDGDQALDYLFGKGNYADRNKSITPGFILLDLKLSRVSGFEVLRRIRKNELTRHIPVVILSTSREKRDIVESYNLGANSYICKPVDYEQFRETVQVLGRYWLDINELP